MTGATDYRLEARVTGRVQGVGFRHFTSLEARRRQLTGFVRNERDGSVTVVAEGARSEVEEFLDALHAEAPPSAEILDVETRWGEPTGEYQGFGIRWI